MNEFWSWITVHFISWNSENSLTSLHYQLHLRKQNKRKRQYLAWSRWQRSNFVKHDRFPTDTPNNPFSSTNLAVSICLPKLLYIAQGVVSLKHADPVKCMVLKACVMWYLTPIVNTTVNCCHFLPGKKEKATKRPTSPLTPLHNKQSPYAVHKHYANDVAGSVWVEVKQGRRHISGCDD